MTRNARTTVALANTDKNNRMKIYLGLGSNLGNRRAHLRSAIRALGKRGVSVGQVSPVVESPALLPPNAESEWNRPFLNLALKGETELRPVELLQLIKQIETDFGRQTGPRWAPRTIDIDILLYGTEEISEDGLRVPHPELHVRPFVLTPLLALDPGLEIPGHGSRTVQQCSQTLAHHIPLWMGILNITPDSFSDGGLWADQERAHRHVSEMVEAGAQIIDLGAESTRPGAVLIGEDEEWSRLAPMLESLIDVHREDLLRPRISIDTYHPGVARRALAAGADIINDVGGLTSDEMIELAASSDAEWVAMHSVSLPADPKQTLVVKNVTGEVYRWFERQMTRWQSRGLDLNRIYIDPGIGFGKNPLQSLQLLRDGAVFRQLGLRTLIGHSRKSFMGSFAASDRRVRDMITVGASMKLIEQGVDVLRVHNIPAHIDAYRGWAHLCRDKSS